MRNVLYTKTCTRNKKRETFSFMNLGFEKKMVDLFFLYYENILLFIVFEYTYLPLCCVRPTSFSSGERVVVVVVVASVFFCLSSSSPRKNRFDDDFGESSSKSF